MLRSLSSRLEPHSLVGILTRAMSAYPPHYVEAIFSKKKQLSLKETDEYIKLSHLPIKAARNDESESIFYHELVNKMANYITKGGNKKLARELLTKSFECMKRVQIERMNLNPDAKNTIIADPEQLLIKAIENSRPLLQLTAIKRGGVKYQVPIPVTEKRSYFLAMKWILEAAREKERKVHLPEKLAWEVLDAAYNQGRVVKKKNDLHRQCEANRAYAHYRWS
ncbi:28S ribosomal protein S7, mitochondrial [Zeugodacus cucurbitae]|uniref:28S ribosomal protein S7, mitochondrial n=1 Tax=Zeugodacus cucurbitae TaxID=28588 RepID=UPI0023D912F1|nr:28S ribosomal protein S7, mitochondrial [Zeugodacus cucurbitae]